MVRGHGCGIRPGNACWAWVRYAGRAWGTALEVLAATIAAPLVSQLGGYLALDLSMAGITVLGSLFVQRIRSVP